MKEISTPAVENGLFHTLTANFISEETQTAYDPTKPNKQILSFGPIRSENGKGYSCVTVTRGKADLSNYESGKVYTLPLRQTIYKDKAYYSTL